MENNPIIIRTYTSGGIKKEGEEYPKLYDSPESAWDAYLCNWQEMRGYSVFRKFHKLPELRAHNDKYVVTSRVKYICLKYDYVTQLYYSKELKKIISLEFYQQRCIENNFEDLENVIKETHEGWKFYSINEFDEEHKQTIISSINA